MIRFKCQNCGRKIRTSEEFAGKRAKCPKCKSLVIVPKWADKSNAEIARQLLHSKPSDDSAQVPEKKKRSFLSPRYDEATLFSMSIAFILLCLTSKTMRTDLHKLTFQVFNFYIAILVLCFVGGLVFSIFHAFSTRQKSVGEKAAMLLFAVFVSAGTGIYAGRHMLQTSTGWLIVFPIRNIIYGGLLLLMLRARVIDVTCISDQDATRPQIILGLIAVLIIVICCQFWFRLHWAITFSICIVYTTSFDRAVQSVFGRR